MEKLQFKVCPTSIPGFSLIKWGHRPDGIADRSLQVETDIAELWTSAPEMQAKLQAAEEMAICLHLILDSVDYIGDEQNKACRITEMVGAVLPKEILLRAKHILPPRWAITRRGKR